MIDRHYDSHMGRDKAVICTKLVFFFFTVLGWVKKLNHEVVVYLNCNVHLS